MALHADGEERRAECGRSGEPARFGRREGGFLRLGSGHRARGFARLDEFAPAYARRLALDHLRQTAQCGWHRRAHPRDERWRKERRLLEKSSDADSFTAQRLIAVE